MQHLVKKHNLNWTVDSAGTGGWHVGSAPDRRSVRTAHGRGIDISGQCCRQVSLHDFDDFDLILAMDRQNMRDILLKARNDDDRAKVRLLLENAEVPDPYYDDNGFEHVYDLVEGGCRKIIAEYAR